MTNPNKSEEWSVFGNTLHLGPQGAPWIAFPGDAGTAQQIAAAHNEVLAELRRQEKQAEAGAAMLRRALYGADRELDTLYGSIADHADAPMWQETPRYREIHAILDTTDAGATLLGQLTRAEAVATAVAIALHELGHDGTVHQHTRDLLAAAVAAYEAGKAS